MVENDWRLENCPDYPPVICDCPYIVPECPGMWTCNDIELITMEIIAYYDTNVDGAINPEDAMEEEHYSLLVDECDTNYDGSVDACELHKCVLDCENAWRDENCPEYGNAYCPCPFNPPQCEGAWNCYDVINIVNEVMEVYDTNYDG